MYWVGWAFSMIVPGQVGDMMSLPALLRRYGYALHTSLGRILLDKLISFAVIIALALWGLPPLLGMMQLDKGIAIVMVVIAVIIAVMFLLRGNVFNNMKIVGSGEGGELFVNLLV